MPVALKIYICLSDNRLFVGLFLLGLNYNLFLNDCAWIVFEMKLNSHGNIYLMNLQQNILAVILEWYTNDISGNPYQLIIWGALDI